MPQASKKRITFKFCFLGGPEHVVVLIHSVVSGKKRIEVDGQLKFEGKEVRAADARCLHFGRYGWGWWWLRVKWACWAVVCGWYVASIPLVADRMCCSIAVVVCCADWLGDQVTLGEFRFPFQLKKHLLSIVIDGPDYEYGEWPCRAVRPAFAEAVLGCRRELSRDVGCRVVEAGAPGRDVAHAHSVACGGCCVSGAVWTDLLVDGRPFRQLPRISFLDMRAARQAAKVCARGCGWGAVAWGHPGVVRCTWFVRHTTVAHVTAPMLLVCSRACPRWLALRPEAGLGHP